MSKSPDVLFFFWWLNEYCIHLTDILLETTETKIKTRQALSSALFAKRFKKKLLLYIYRFVAAWAINMFKVVYCTCSKCSVLSCLTLWWLWPYLYRYCTWMSVMLGWLEWWKVWVVNPNCTTEVWLYLFISGGGLTVELFQLKETLWQKTSVFSVEELSLLQVKHLLKLLL